MADFKTSGAPSQKNASTEFQPRESGTPTEAGTDNAPSSEQFTFHEGPGVGNSRGGIH